MDKFSFTNYIILFVVHNLAYGTTFVLSWLLYKVEEIWLSRIKLKRESFHIEFKLQVNNFSELDFWSML